MKNMSKLLGLLLIFVRLTVNNFGVGGESDGLTPTNKSVVHINTNSSKNVTISETDSSEEYESSSGRNTESANYLQNATANSDIVFSAGIIPSSCHDDNENVTIGILSQSKKSRSMNSPRKTNLIPSEPRPPGSSLEECPTSNSDVCQTFSLDLNIHCDFTCKRCLSNAELCNMKQPSVEPAEKETCVHSLHKKGVLMVVSCPLDYENEDIRGYCETFQANLLYDLWLMTPVTDFETNTTYKNVFCAACNVQLLDNIQFWDLLLFCYDRVTREKRTHFRNIDQNDGIISKLHPRKTGFWKYRQRKTQTEDFCFFHPIMVSDVLFHSVRSCTSKPAITRRIESLVEENFKNQIFTDESNSFGGNYSSESFNISSFKSEPLKRDVSQQYLVLNLKNKSLQIPRFSGCGDKRIFQMKSLHDILCTGPDGKAKCKLKVVGCVIAEYFKVKLANFNLEDYETYSINETHSFVCGPKVADSIQGSKVMDKIVTVILFVLRSAVMGLIFHLLIFAWLPAKSTLDKSLGYFGFVLLIQNLCALYDSQKDLLSCRIVASIWHYSMLSSFTWVLILSYDCWLNLRQIFQLYDLIDEYDSLQFLIYFAASQIIPLLVTSAALNFGSSPADSYCQQNLGLDRYECLLSEVPGFTPFFIISALFLFALNIYFLVRIGCLVFSRKLYLKEVRQKFNDRSGFALMMSPAWMLSFLLILTHFELLVSDTLIITVHVLQSVSFLIYAFNQWLGRIMQKYEKIERCIFGELVYCPMSTSVLLTEDRQLLGILEGRQLEQNENENLYA